MLVVVMAAALVAVACESAEPTATPAPAVVSVSLALDWFPNSNHAGFYVAQQRGYYSEEGLDVEIVVPANPEDVLKTVGAGRDDFGVSYQAEVLLARGEGVPVKSIAAMVQHPLNSIMVLEESGIERPADLVGRSVGVTGIPFEEALFLAMLQHDGGAAENVTLVNVGFDLSPALIGKKVDAIVGAYWTHESIAMEKQGYPVSVLRMEEWGVPDFYELVLVAGESPSGRRSGRGGAVHPRHGQGIRRRHRRSAGGRGHSRRGQPGDRQRPGVAGHRAAGSAVVGGGRGLWPPVRGAVGEPRGVDEVGGTPRGGCGCRGRIHVRVSAVGALLETLAQPVWRPPNPFPADGGRDLGLRRGLLVYGQDCEVQDARVDLDPSCSSGIGGIVPAEGSS